MLVCRDAHTHACIHMRTQNTHMHSQAHTKHTHDAHLPLRPAHACWRLQAAAVSLPVSEQPVAAALLGCCCHHRRRLLLTVRPCWVCCCAVLLQALHLPLHRPHPAHQHQQEESRAKSQDSSRRWQRREKESSAHSAQQTVSASTRVVVKPTHTSQHRQTHTPSSPCCCRQAPSRLPAPFL